MSVLQHGNTENKKVLQKEGLTLFLMILPFLLLIFAFSYVPLFGWIYAFFDYQPGIPLSKTPFVGMKKFIQLFTDWKDTVRVIENTLVLSFLGILATPFPVILSILLNEVRSSKFRKLIQTTTTLPNFISWVLVFSVAFAMFSTEGFLNQILSLLGIHTAVNVLGNDDMVWIFQTLVHVWKVTGWNAIIYMAAIAGIDKELYDAARVDGAGRFHSIIHVTLPGLTPTYFVLLILSIGSLLNGGSGLEQYLVFNNPLVADKIEVLDLYVYRLGLVVNDYSYATAVGALKSVISIILLFFANFLAKKTRGEGII